jgi:DnaJ-class molecular chaperone
MANSRSALRRVAWLVVLLLGFVSCAARDADPYRLLDISRGATDSDIKKSYRKLSLKYHPDKQQGKAADEVEKAANKFMSIQKAYETLSDPEKKRNYDMTGFADPMDAYRSSPGGRGGQQQRRGPGSAGRGGWDSDTAGFPGAGGRFGGFGFPQADPITSETQELTPKNFEKLVLNSNKAWLIQVYHDASEKCQRAAPVWDQTARTLDGSAKLGRVNMATYPDLAAKVAPQHRFSSSFPL